jgi:hypothetical protein
MRGWHGVLTENCVQGAAADLLREALLRLEARGLKTTLHVHDELVVEAKIGTVTEAEFLALVLEPPSWASDLPLAGTVRTGRHYLEPAEQPGTPPPEDPGPSAIDRTLDEVAEDDDELEPDAETAEEEVEEELEDRIASIPLTELVAEPLNSSDMIACPFHDDAVPSLKIYSDQYHCHGCGAHGDHIKWLTEVEGYSHDEALEILRTWEGPAEGTPTPAPDGYTLRQALRIWQAAVPIGGTLAAQYLVEHRHLDLAKLPADLDAVLRFHPRCPFGAGVQPALIARMVDVANDDFAGLQRIALGPNGNRLERQMLGRWPTPRAVKLWTAGRRLVIGEGLETVLAGATERTWRGPLQPAWALLSAGAMARFPLVAGVEELIVLVDNDTEGRNAAAACAARWTAAGRQVAKLIPRGAGTDFNDLLMNARPP